MHPWLLKARSFIAPMFALRSQPPLALFTAWFTGFIASQYFIESSFIYRTGFYLTLITFIALWVRQPVHVYAIPRNAGTLSLVALAALVLFHALVISQGVEASKTLRDLATNSAFVAMCLVMFRQPDEKWDRFIHWLVIVMAACAAISLLHYGLFPNERVTVRLIPIGRAGNPLVGANMYGFALMVALAVWLRDAPSRGVRLAALTLIVLVPPLTALTQSRGPMLAQVLGVALALLLFKRTRLLVALMLLGALTAGVVWFGELPMLAPLKTKIEFVLFARDSLRLQVWDYTLGLIEQRPWTGYGLRAIFNMPQAPTVVNPHNIFLSCAYYLGWPGLAIFLAPLGFALLRAARDGSWYAKLCLLLMAHAALALFTDGGQAIKSPSPIWTLYWLPLAMALARSQKVSVGHA